MAVVTSKLAETFNNTAAEKERAWFPTHASDLDRCANDILYGACEVDAEHPGYADGEYRTRRQYFEKIAREFKFGEQIPRIEYTAEEKNTWALVYNQLISLYPKYACREFNEGVQLLQQRGIFTSDELPQLQDVSDFLKERTGFTLRPVAGLVSPRRFFAGLAFRVFHSTQYIRHASSPNYSTEPDLAHEVLGHVPMLANNDFADFSQEIGLASLGASDSTIEQLSTLYWFTIEFGMCLQNGQKKAFGGCLLSASGELEYAMTDKPQVLAFDPEIASVTPYPISEYQPTYFLAESFAVAKEQMREWTAKIERPFKLHYNADTESVVVEKKSQ